MLVRESMDSGSQDVWELGCLGVWMSGCRGFECFGAEKSICPGFVEVIGDVYVILIE